MWVGLDWDGSEGGCVVDGGRRTVCSASKEEDHCRGLYARVAQYSL